MNNDTTTDETISETAHACGCEPCGDITCCCCEEPVCVACHECCETCDQPVCESCHDGDHVCESCRMEEEDVEEDEQDEEELPVVPVAAVPVAAVPVVVAGDRSPVRHVRLGVGLDEALRAESERTGAPASEIIRRALKAYLS
jgi:hypothetical protein